MRGFSQNIGCALVIGASLAVACPAAAGDGFGPFPSETKRLGEAVRCKAPKTTPAGYGMGALYGCIAGKGQSAKLFINESGERSGTVENVKVMWNDWFKDGGDGVHADKSEAALMLDAVTGIYVPASGKAVREAFFGAGSKTVEEGRFKVTVKVTRGPSIDERLLVVTER